MKQVYNKITGKYELMPISTANALLTVDKVTILKDDEKLKVIILKEFEYNGIRYHCNNEINMLVVEAHRWQLAGYCKIIEDKKPLPNKIEKITVEKKINAKKKK